MLSATWLATTGRTVIVCTIMPWCFLQPLLAGRKSQRWRACVLLGVFLVSFALTVVLVNECQSNYEHVIRKSRLQSRRESVGKFGSQVWDPRELVDSRSVGPKCSSLLLIFITSAPGNKLRRDVIRRTWAQPTSFNRRYDWQYMFAIGRFENETLRTEIAAEMHAHNDILLGDYVDTYRNLTTKVYHGMVWTRLHCPRTKFFFKTDDDCFVNTVILPQLVQDYHMDDSGLYLGKIFRRTNELKVLRTVDGPWSVNEHEYPASSYPPYASGVGYLLSIDVVDAILERSRSIKPFPVEDAYNGVVAASLGVEPVHSGRFTVQSTAWSMCNLLYLLVIHHVTNENQIKFFEMAQNAKRFCNVPLITKWN